MKQTAWFLVGLALVMVAGMAAGQDFPVESFFDVYADLPTTAGPPYPSQPPIRMASYGGGMYLEDIELDFGPGSDPFDNLIMDAMDSGGPAGGDPGKTATLMIRSPDGSFNVDSFFDITYRIDFEGPERAIAKVDLPSGDFAVDSFFDITYQIELADGERGTRSVRGTILPGQPAVEGISGYVIPSGDFPVDSFFDITFEIDFGDIPLDAGLPLLSIQLEGEHTPEPASVVLLATGVLAVLACAWRKRRR